MALNSFYDLCCSANQLVQRESKAASLSKSRHRLQERKEWSANELNALQNSSYCLVAQSCLTVCDPLDYIACQIPLSVGFPRQEYWSGLPFPSPGIKPVYPAWQADSLPLSHLRSPRTSCTWFIIPKSWGRRSILRTSLPSIQLNAVITFG